MTPECRSTTGFVYVATGERYRREAATSAATLRRHHPEARICLITDAAHGEKFWDDLVVLPAPRFGFRDKIAMRQAPYERAVFLDTDTTVCGDLTPLFAILSRYDVCGVQISEGQDYVMDGGIPHAFPEMNAGVLGFRAGPSTAEFFSQWERFYDEFHRLNRDSYHYANVGDQKSLRAALWHSNVRHACIGAEFNFIPFRLELASLPVAVLHTRAATNGLAARLNARLGRRAYVPTLDAVIKDEMPISEARRVFFAAARLLARAASRTLLPRTLRDGLRRRRWFSRWAFGNRYESPASPTDAAKWEAGSSRP